LLAGVETVPEPPFTAVILPEDAMLMGVRVLKRLRWFNGWMVGCLVIQDKIAFSWIETLIIRIYYTQMEKESEVPG
jgi:hypothetical protein